MPTMLGLVFPGNSTAELRELSVPDPAPTEVRLRIQASGLCGSDFMSYRSPEGLRNPGTGDLVIAGHEPAGIVDAVGSHVTAFAPGDRVLAYHILGCGFCHQCRLGYPVSCTSTSRVAYGGQRHGGHGEYMTAEERSLIALPPQLSFIDGATVACGTSTAYAATRRAEVRAGDRVLVTGLGPVGLAVAMFAADAGAEVIGLDPNLDRADFARQYGVHHLVTSTTEEEALEQIAEVTVSRGVSVAIDCSGSDAARQLALRAASTWGRVVFVGIGGGAMTVDAAEIFILKQLSLHGSWISSLAQMEEVVSLLRDRDLHPDAMVTTSYDLAESPGAYEAFSAGSVGKLVVVA